MKPAFLDILACPECMTPFTLVGGTTSAEIESGHLHCKHSHSYVIRDAIPRFVSSEDYAANFGFEWMKHSRTQLDNPVSQESEATFELKTGFRPADLAGKLVLDVGCGMGRFSDVVSRWGATVVGIDLTRAVDAACANLEDRPGVHLAQADVFRLPFAPATFDVIFSIGVLHHTPRTKEAFDMLPGLLKPDGKIAIWLYANYQQWYRMADIWRRVTTRMPKRLLYALSHIAVPLYYPGRIPILGRIPGFLLPTSMHPKHEWRVLDTFDWYSPRYQWKHSYEEVWPWFEAHGLTQMRVCGVPVSVQATMPRRPSAPPRRLAALRGRALK